MKLRTRLVLALFVLSVVPLGAATAYTYIGNARALRETAEHQADLLASELTARMQLVTAELSDRITQLAMEQSAPPPEAPAAKTAVAPAAAAPAPEVLAAQALGDAAVLLNSVEVRGRGFGRYPRPGPGRSNAPSSATTPAVGTAPATPVDRATSPTRGEAGSRPTPPATSPGSPGAPPVATIDPNDASRVVIDMSQVTHDLARKFVPEGTSFASLTPEQRQEIGREMSEHLLGIQEGIRIGAAELQKRADEARKKANDDAQAATSPNAASPAQSASSRSALKGNKLGVTVEQNGKVVHQVNAEINLDNVLLTVFSTTRRDQGEVPFAIARDGKLYTQNPADKTTLAPFAAILSPTGPLGTTVKNDWIIVTTADPSGSGLRFGIARPVGDSLSALRRTTGRSAALSLLLIGLAAIGIVPISARLTRNLSRLTTGVERIARGDYATRVDVRSRDEVGDLAKAFNKMAADVEVHQRALVGQERIKRELELGRQIQNEMLPHEPLKLGLTEVKGVSVPAREVGGDFFNYFTLSRGEVALLVGDVSGKGVGAALLMANIQASLRTRLTLGQDLSAIAEAIDREIDETVPDGVYATLFIGIFNPVTRRIRYVNAGHHPQFVLRAQGGLDLMPSTGLPVGLLSGRGYTDGDLQLAAGDLIFFYTDGCVETENAQEEPFGAERLESLLLDAHAASPDQVLARVEAAVTKFRGAREPFDDATMMVVRVG